MPQENKSAIIYGLAALIVIGGIFLLFGTYSEAHSSKCCLEANVCDNECCEDEEGCINDACCSPEQICGDVCCENDEYCKRVKTNWIWPENLPYCTDCPDDPVKQEPNGCGGENTQVADDPCAEDDSWTQILGKWLLWIYDEEMPDSCDFGAACDGHDICFATCAEDDDHFDKCNTDFLFDMRNVCVSNRSEYTDAEFDTCMKIAKEYASWAESEGHYDAAQGNDCCYEEENGGEES